MYSLRRKFKDVGKARSVSKCIKSNIHTIDDLHKKDEYLTQKINVEKRNAYNFLKANQKVRAMDCIKRKKSYEEQQQKIMSMINNLLVQQTQVDEAATNIKVFNEYRKTNNTIKKQFGGLNADKISGSIDDLDETTQNLNDVSEIITNDMGPHFDNDELEEEMEDLNKAVTEEKNEKARLKHRAYWSGKSDESHMSSDDYEMDEPQAMA